MLLVAVGTLLLGAVIWAFLRLYPPSSGRHAILVGLLWAGPLMSPARIARP